MKTLLIPLLYLEVFRLETEYLLEPAGAVAELAGRRAFAAALGRVLERDRFVRQEFRDFFFRERVATPGGFEGDFLAAESPCDAIRRCGIASATVRISCSAAGALCSSTTAREKTPFKMERQN